MKIYITRHAESLNNTLNIIGGDSGITEKGNKYAYFLAQFFDKQQIHIWTSTSLRTKQTSSHFKTTTITPHIELNEIFAGDFENLDINTIKTLHPKIYEHRHKDKLNNSYTNGENYLDLEKRVFKLLNTIDMKKDDILLIISHQATCRVIYSYFTQTPLYECVDLPIDLHTLYKLDNKKFIPLKYI